MRYILLIIAGILALSSCHVETPLAMDIEAPTATIVSITKIGSGETLYNLQNDSTFTNFTTLIDSGSYRVKCLVRDNQGINKINLVAAEKNSNLETVFRTATQPANDTVIFNFDAEMFPVGVATSAKSFSIYLKAQDNTENISTSSKKLGFQVFVKKAHPLEKLTSQFGNYTTIDSVGKTHSVDLSTKKNRLVFVHFHMLNCGSCREEATSLNSFIYGTKGKKSTVEDTSKVYVASFGSDKYPEMTEEYVLNFKYSNDLVFDCFLDKNLKLQKFMINSFMPGYWKNGVIAFFPDGHSNRYDSDLYPRFSNWLNAVYDEFQAKSKK